MERQIDYSNKTGKCPICESYGAKEVTRYLSWNVTFITFKCTKCNSKFDVLLGYKILGTRLIRKGNSKWRIIKSKLFEKIGVQNQK